MLYMVCNYRKPFLPSIPQLKVCGVISKNPTTKSVWFLRLLNINGGKNLDQMTMLPIIAYDINSKCTKSFKFYLDRSMIHEVSAFFLILNDKEKYWGTNCKSETLPEPMTFTKSCNHAIMMKECTIVIFWYDLFLFLFLETHFLQNSKDKENIFFGPNPIIGVILNSKNSGFGWKKFWISFLTFELVGHQEKSYQKITIHAFFYYMILWGHDFRKCFSFAISLTHKFGLIFL